MGTTPRGLPYPESTDLVADGAAAIEALATATDTELNDATNDALTQANAYTDTTTAGIQDAAVDQAVAEAKTYTDTTTAGIQDAAVDQAVAEANAYTDTAIANAPAGETAATAAAGDGAYYTTDATGAINITPPPPAEGTWTLEAIASAPATDGTNFYIPYLRRNVQGTATFLVHANGEPMVSTSVFLYYFAVFARQEETPQ